MKLLKRTGYYLIGLVLGCIVVLFIWKGKDVAFPYGPDARTLSSIRKKPLVYSDLAKSSMQVLQIDSIAIQTILTSGDVNFGKSNARKKPCAEYAISGVYENKTLELWVIRCEAKATIEKVSLKKD